MGGGERTFWNRISGLLASPMHTASVSHLQRWAKVLRDRNSHDPPRLRRSLGKQLPAWAPGKAELPGLSARKSDCTTRAENLTNKSLEFYPNSCSSPSRSADSLGPDACCNIKFEVSPVWCQELAPWDKERTVALLMGAENKTPSPRSQPPGFVVKLSLCL